tara:strand:+ start:215 stop:457 length:243 start_codon:yes stop_codon:yes gene_type:complete
MNSIALYISKDTIEKRKYLIDFHNKLEKEKLQNKKIDVYNLSLNDNYKFWNDIYDDYKLEEDKCNKKIPRIGIQYQVSIN